MYCLLCVYVLCVFFSLPFYYFSPICAFRWDFFHLNLYLFKYVYLEFTTCNWRVCVLNRWLLWLVSNVILRRVYLPKLERTELKLKMQSNAEHINVCWRYLDSLFLSLLLINFCCSTFMSGLFCARFKQSSHWYYIYTRVQDGLVCILCEHCALFVSGILFPFQMW